MTHESLTQLMVAIGFEKVFERWKEEGKMAYWLFRKLSLPEAGEARAVVGFDKKAVLREGGKRNNFCVLV